VLVGAASNDIKLNSKFSLFRTSSSPILNPISFKLLGSQTLARFRFTDGLAILILLSIAGLVDSATAADPNASLCLAATRSKSRFEATYLSFAFTSNVPRKSVDFEGPVSYRVGKTRK
jgi:hypothetical protein